MKRIVIFLTVLLFVSNVFAANKKAVLVIPGENGNEHGYGIKAGVSIVGVLARLGISCDVREYTDKGLKPFLRSIDTDEYGIVIFYVSDPYSVRPGHNSAYGDSTYYEFVTSDPNYMIDIGIPTILISRLYIIDDPYGGNHLLCGAKDSGLIWDIGSDSMNDSLKIVNSLGDTTLIYHADNTKKIQLKHETFGDPTVDIYVAGNENNMLMWHYYSGDSARYYIPNYNYLPFMAYDREKMLMAVIGKYFDVDAIPVTIAMHDYGFEHSYSTQVQDSMYDHLDNLFSWCESNQKHIDVFTEYRMNHPYMPARGAKWGSSDYVHMRWGFDNQYATNGKEDSRTLFHDWGDDDYETLDSLVSMLQANRYYFDSLGYGDYVDTTTFTFGRHDYTGAHKDDKEYDIFRALAKMGVRNFIVVTRYAAYQRTNDYHYYNLFEKRLNVPIDLSATGDSTIVNINIIPSIEHPMLGDDWVEDTTLVAPSRVSDSTIIANMQNLFIYFMSKELLSNSRLKDGTDDPSHDYYDPAVYDDWTGCYNMQSDAISFYAHDYASVDSVYWTNPYKELLEIVWDNFDFYNDIAGKDVFVSKSIVSKY